MTSLRLYTSDLAWYEQYMHKLVDEALRGFAPAAARLAAYVPRLAGVALADIPGSDPSLDDARWVYAREHGFDDWDGFAAHVTAVADGTRQEPFVEFIHAVEAGDPETLTAHLDRDPALVSQVASTGKSPLHSAGDAATAALLIERGAALELEFPLPGATALIHALVWGASGRAEAIAAHCLAPMNLRVGAGLGRLDLLATMVTNDGALAPGAGRGRDAYRPNYGWYAWQSSDTPQEILDEALIYAATSGRTEAAAFLVERGADIDGVAYETRPLIRAAWRGHLETVDWLLDRGADVEAVGWLGGHCQGTTALHIAAQSGHMALTQRLVERGADPTRRDDLYDGTPDGWADHHGHAEIAEWLRRIREARESG